MAIDHTSTPGWPLVPWRPCWRVAPCAIQCRGAGGTHALSASHVRNDANRSVDRALPAELLAEAKLQVAAALALRPGLNVVEHAAKSAKRLLASWATEVLPARLVALAPILLAATIEGKERLATVCELALRVRVVFALTHEHVCLLASCLLAWARLATTRLKMLRRVTHGKVHLPAAWARDRALARRIGLATVELLAFVVAAMAMHTWVGKDVAKVVHRPALATEELRLTLAWVVQVRAHSPRRAPNIELHRVLVVVEHAQDDQLALAPLVVVFPPTIRRGLVGHIRRIEAAHALLAGAGPASQLG